MNFKKTLAAAAILAVSTGAMASIAAPQTSGLDGQSMSLAYYFPTLSSVIDGPYNFVAGPGSSVPIDSFVGNLNVSGDKITIDFTYGPAGFTPAQFNGFVLTSATPGLFGSVSVDAATTEPNFSSSFISTSANSLSVDWAGMSFSSGEQIVLDVTPSVPEAGNAAMMFAGLAVVAGLARRRRAK